MTQSSRTRRSYFESLETRSLLAATADIIFVVDESGSQGTEAPVRPWVVRIAEDLQTKLETRGFSNNQFGVVGFGEGDLTESSNRARIVRTNGASGDQFVSDAANIDDFLEHFENAGDREDAWQAVGTASDNPNISSHSDFYEFRPNAAVHFIVVSDEDREKQGVNGNSGGTAVDGTPIYASMLEGLFAENLTVSGQLDAMDDAVVTVVAPFQFSEFNDAFEILNFEEDENDFIVNETILGIDVHRLDGLNLDRNSRAVNGDDDPGANEYAVFKYRDFVDEDDDNFVWVDGTLTVSFLDAGSTYANIKDELNNPCDATSVDDCFMNGDPINGDPIEQPGTHNPYLSHPNNLFLSQDSFESEEEAFMAWEARGTAWDFDILQQAFRDAGGWHGDPEDFLDNVNRFDGFDDPLSLFSQFNRAFVDDTFEKILLQTMDLDRLVGLPPAVASQLYSGASNGDIQQGYISASDIDVMTYYLRNPNERTAETDLALDVNQDGNVNVADRDHLIMMALATWMGDSNLDGLYDSGDFVFVFTTGEYEDSTTGNSGWADGDWNGDFEFLTSDFVAAFTDGGYERASNSTDDDGDGDTDEDGEGYRDTNGDDEEDFRPVWFVSGTPIYRPNWG